MKSKKGRMIFDEETGEMYVVGRPNGRFFEMDEEEIAERCRLLRAEDDAEFHRKADEMAEAEAKGLVSGEENFNASLKMLRERLLGNDERKDEVTEDDEERSKTA